MCFNISTNRYAGRDDDDRNMEANFDDIMKEERRRYINVLISSVIHLFLHFYIYIYILNHSCWLGLCSARIAREEDEKEAQLIAQEEERERLRKIRKNR